jgi:hypothetical protein
MPRLTRWLSEGGADVRVMFARLEAKLDVAITQHTEKLERHGSEIADLRAIVRKIDERPVAHPEGVLDHETRLRHIENERLPAIEGRPVVTPRAMWTAVATLTAVVGTLTAIVSLLLHH